MSRSLIFLSVLFERERHARSWTFPSVKNGDDTTVNVCLIVIEASCYDDLRTVFVQYSRLKSKCMIGVRTRRGLKLE